MAPATQKLSQKQLGAAFGFKKDSDLVELLCQWQVRDAWREFVTDMKASGNWKGKKGKENTALVKLCIDAIQEDDIQYSDLAIYSRAGWNANNYCIRFVWNFVGYCRSRMDLWGNDGTDIQRMCEIAVGVLRVLQYNHTDSKASKSTIVKSMKEADLTVDGSRMTVGEMDGAAVHGGYQREIEAAVDSDDEIGIYIREDGSFGFV